MDRTACKWICRHHCNSKLWWKLFFFSDVSAFVQMLSWFESQLEKSAQIRECFCFFWCRWPKQQLLQRQHALPWPITQNHLYSPTLTFHPSLYNWAIPHNCTVQCKCIHYSAKKTTTHFKIHWKRHTRAFLHDTQPLFTVQSIPKQHFKRNFFFQDE